MLRFYSSVVVLSFLFVAPIFGQQAKVEPGEKEQKSKNPVVVMQTNKGTIKIELFIKKAPITVKNFLKYVKKKHYDGLIFHRVISNFMIQGGGFTPKMVQRPTGAGIKNESFNGLSNQRGTIAMARTNNPDSATAQFYINVKDNTFLDKKNAKDGVGYCVFGRVISGMKVVDQIKAVETGRNDVPTQPVIIKSVRILKK